MNKGSYESAVRCFEELLSIDPLFKKNIYLLIGIAWKKLNRIESSIKIVTPRLALVNERSHPLRAIFRLPGLQGETLLEDEYARESHP